MTINLTCKGDSCLKEKNKTFAVVVMTHEKGKERRRVVSQTTRTSVLAYSTVLGIIGGELRQLSTDSKNKDSRR